MFKIQIKWLLWCWLTQWPTTQVACPFPRRTTSTWWCVRSCSSSPRSWGTVNAHTCVTMSLQSCKYRREQFKQDRWWDWWLIAKHQQPMTMETACVRTLSIVCLDWQEPWCIQFRSGFQSSWTLTMDYGAGRWDIPAGCSTGLQWFMVLLLMSWCIIESTRAKWQSLQSQRLHTLTQCWNGTHVGRGSLSWARQKLKIPMWFSLDSWWCWPIQLN